MGAAAGVGCAAACAAGAASTPSCQCYCAASWARLLRGRRGCWALTRSETLGWQVGDADAKFFSATIRWERIGATPQMLRNLCDPAFCQTDPCQATAAGTQCFMNAPGCIDFNFDRDAGCSSYDHRTVLYTVNLRSACALSALPVCSSAARV
jgi:hypothetical protein